VPRFKLLIEYAGTRYSGWQIQKNARTVQGEIDRAVREVSASARSETPSRASARPRQSIGDGGSKRREFELYGSGRTDAGVHALAQMAHLELYTTLPPESLRRQLNDELPADINIREITKVAHRFHARHDAIARSYLYQISRRRTAFGKPFVWWVRDPLDVDRMREAAAAFVGMKDFASFTDDDPGEKSTVVLVDGIEIAEVGSLILLRVQGSHFLWKMVRRIVGVVAACGRGELKPAEAAAMLSGTAPRTSPTPAELTAPAAGLFLESVRYEGDRPPGPLRPVMMID
jgi:tRNA pseudouridine38-40 synthase